MNGNGHDEDSSTKIRRTPTPIDDGFQVKLSLKFLITSLLSCLLISLFTWESSQTRTLTKIDNKTRDTKAKGVGSSYIPHRRKGTTITLLLPKSGYL